MAKAPTKTTTDGAEAPAAKKPAARKADRKSVV